MEAPLHSASDGRGPGGRFVRGNRFGKGNPHARRAGRLRSALLRETTPGDIETVARTLIEQAKSGDVAAAKLLLDRVLGPPVPLDLLERLAALEEHLGWE